LWSNNWGLFAINDYGFPNRPFNGSFHVCAPDPADATKSYITKIDFNQAGFRPGGFNVAFNSFGILDDGTPFPQSAYSYEAPTMNEDEAINQNQKMKYF
jgi:hypothetical protein